MFFILFNLLSTIIAPNFPAQINFIPMINEVSFKSRNKYNKYEDIALGCMDLGLDFIKNDKTETSSTLSKLISIGYKCKDNIREYIMEKSNFILKLKTL